METYDINDCSLNDSFVVYYKDKKIVDGVEKVVGEYRTLTGEHLLLTFEGDLNAIAYTKAVDKHIDRSIKFTNYNKGYNDFIKDFESGRYDTEDELEKVYEAAEVIFHNEDIVFVIVDGSIMLLDKYNDIVEEICTLYRNNLDSIDLDRFKYLGGFVESRSKNKELKMN